MVVSHTNDDEIFTLKISRRDLGKLHHLLKDFKYTTGTPEYNASYKQTAERLMENFSDQYSQQFDDILKAETIVEEAKVRLPIFDEKQAKDWTYKCGQCSASLTVNSDSGHLAYQYWKEHHSHPA